jgi:hypothetical protein
MPPKGSRKSHCKNGHPRILENIFPSRACRICQKDRQAKRHAERQANDPEYRKQKQEYDLHSRTGWTLESKEIALFEQAGLCEICKKFMLRPCADHKHNEPPIPRGLLCETCNWAIGLFYDSPKLCETAAQYLRKYEGSSKG